MNWLFIDSFEQCEILEHISFYTLLAQTPSSHRFQYQKKSDSIHIHQYIARHRPSAILMSSLIPLYTKTPKFIFSPKNSSIVSKLFRSTYWIHHTTKQSTRSYSMPVLLREAPYIHKTNGFVLLSVGSFLSTSCHRLVLDAFALLPKRIQKQYSLVCCGEAYNQSEIDLIQLLGYSLPLHIETDIQKLDFWLKKSAIVFRMGNNKQNNTMLDAIILKYDVIVIHDGNTDRSALYPKEGAMPKGTPESLSEKIMSIVRSPKLSFFREEEQTRRFSLYQNLISSLPKQ